MSAGELAIDLHQDFYAPEAVARAVEAFVSHAQLKLEERAPYSRVILSGAAPEVLERLRHELANWALAAGALGDSSAVVGKP